MRTPEGPQSSQWADRYERVHMQVFGRPGRVMDHGRGAWIWDLDGNRYLDMMAGIAVNALGYAHPAWNKALAEQAGKMAHISNFFASQPQIELAERLLDLAQAPKGSRIFFANSGTEANEAAIKLARLHGARMGGHPGRILALIHSFHGRSMGSLSLTWKPAIREPFQPLVPGMGFLPAEDDEAIEEAFAQGETSGEPVAAIILELIQGEAGVLPLNPDYVSQVRELCSRHGALMILDEVQTGMGRTGHWFAFQDQSLSGGACPDVLTFAKGVAGGFPMGGMITFGPGPSGLLTPGLHGSTFGGNPLGSALALTTLETIQREGLLERARQMGERLRAGLTDCGNPLYTQVRGRGLLDAVQLSVSCAGDLASWALNHGLIVNAVAPDALRLAPPLIIQADQIDLAVDILSKAPASLADRGMRQDDQ
ncbi:MULTISPECIES: acetylornithine transaminase [Bifidobacterium]|uniref:acetylornithine transaminase n=1 Tax=Bifidobacterium TaxID=1678 RepID=UPI0018DB4243|nr:MULTISPECIES: acetylornithine transaminase [Bifidobacterium]MBH9979793.1 acetylornithine transaminase [Bifidobacterium asteroides]MBI0098963.1 acetylornithine transaminase [Bifidobacterium sp. W8114]